MSNVTIKQTLETAIAEMEPVISTSKENVDFTPVSGVPYQEIYFLPATPDNTEQGVKNYRAQGFVQVNLKYPLNEGTAGALTRASLIETTFKKGTTLTKDGLTINVIFTPTIFAGFKDNDRWCIPVRIFYLADIHL